MGREVRRVPPNWEHPKDDKGRYIPQHDEAFEPAVLTYLEQAKQWARGEHPDQEKASAKKYTFIEWHGDSSRLGSCMFLTEPPDRSWFQMYENVSEGTPVSPPFATKEELVDWIAANLGHSRAAAEKFVEVGYVPSMMMTVGPAGTDIRMNIEQLEPEPGT